MERNILKYRLNPCNKKVKVGIDEAGRGPVLGYLVYGCIIYKEGKNYGFKDSKQLSADQREKMWEKIMNSDIDYIYNALHPQYLSDTMNIKSLNEISYEAVFKMLDLVFINYKNCEVYLDALGPNTTYMKVLNGRYPGKKFIVKNKADSLYDVVSGASILAKVTRDRLLSTYTDVSGYPGDPNTVEWLHNNFNPVFGFSDIVRFSWQTVKRFFKKRNPGNYLKGRFSSLSTQP